MAWSLSIPTCILSIRVGSAMTLLSFQDLMCLGVWHNIVQYDIAMLFAIPALLIMYTSPLVFALYFNLFRKQEIFDELQPIYLGPHIFPSSPNFTPWRAVDIFFHILPLVYWNSLFNGPLLWNTSLVFSTCSHSLSFRCFCHLLPWCNAQSPALNSLRLWHGMPPATIFMYRWFKGGLSCHLFVCDISSY